ncbi:BnaA01g19050D [Brassica napus]|uniref:BnaA01g19050D protein n=1 Tax=Brassica napus TaxID=3708 RepID=A0A078GW65_BRANA|nr:BnaA01g19050D [Brassica napus]
MSKRRSIRGEETGAANASARRRSLRGKEIAEDSTEMEDVKESLPGRLFATDRFPSERVNTYSTTDFLLCVRDLLKGSVEMGQILGSCFGRLFSLPVRRMLAGKVVHGMLTRQVVTKKKYELWPVFGGKPFRFSLVEFGEVTGKLRLCLIIIVDGVLVPNAQKPKPSLKHVNLVKNLKKFFAFQWGRESFLAAIRTMLPGPKVMGKCEDPNGDFCKKLRQKTVRLLGFPQALQLVAFEVIPRLLVQAGGDDSVTLMNFPGKVLPQHSGLNVCDLREAEHDPALIVQPMMEISGVHEERWGVWDDEKYDKKRRLSGYFKREIMVDGEEHARMVSRVEELGTEVLRLKEVVEKQGRQFVKWKTFMKGKSAAKKFGSVRRRDKRKTDGGARDGTEDFYSDGGGAGYRKEQMSGEIGEDDFSREEGARTSSEERPALLVRMKEGDRVPLQWVEPESGDNVLYRALTSQTYFVSEEEGSSVDGGRRDDGGQGDGLDEKARETEGREEKEEGGTEDGGRDENQEEDARKTEVCESGQYMFCVLCTGGRDENQEEDARKTEVCESKLRETEDGGRDENQEEDARKTEVCESGQYMFSVHVYKYCCTRAQVDVLDGSGEDTADEEPSSGKIVLDVSDTSDFGVTSRHEPVEQEGELAALLLAKDQYVVPEIIPLVEDPDYAFFERVLMAHSKVLHINARGYDLDNEFFIDLGTPCKWVTSTHMDVMMEYVGSLHAETLRKNRAMFVAPWFSAHLQGKGRSFRAARRKTLIAADSRATKFLTTEGKQWGVDVDTWYAPMIWDGDHWVRLCIRLTTWDVLVLDPRPGFKSVEEVATLMAPVVEMLPYLAKKVCPADAIGEHQLVPFHVERVAGLYENRRSGDCGPVAAKFMEIHATGDGIARMAGLNDDLVSIFRKQYAMEIYKDWVLPLYM